MKAPPSCTIFAKYGSSTNTATLTIAAATTADAAANYNCLLSNFGGSVTSPNGTLTVSVPQPVFGNTSSILAGNAHFAFTSPNVYDTASAFTLQSCGVLNGTFTNAVPAGTITGPTGGPFSVVVPQTADTMFYKLLHVP